MDIDINVAKFNPTSVFKRPRDVLKHPSLSRAQKIEILQSWAYDERDKEVAEEENMPSPGLDNKNILSEITDCLLELGLEDDEKAPPTKQG